MYSIMALMTEATKSNVLKSLEIMWKGILAIFIVIGIVAVATFIMNDIAASRKTGELYVQRLWKKIKNAKNKQNVEDTSEANKEE